MKVNSNKEFYKRVGFVFVGIIMVLIVAKFTVLETPQKGVVEKIAATSKKQSKQVINWQDADKHYGEYLTVKGKIVKTYNSGKACFLNFHPDYKRYFTAVIFQSAFDKFPSQPEVYYNNKKVQITGVIKEYNGSPEIILNSPSQIKVLE